MGKTLLTLVFLLAIVFGCLLLVPTVSGTESSAFEKDPQILVIHSYYPTYGWSDDITKGIVEAFEQSEYADADLFFEYMDTKRHSEQVYLDSMTKYFRQKYYGTDEFDLIIVADDYAIEFLCSDQGKEIFGTDIPVIFVGATNFDEQWMVSRPFMTGVIETNDPASTTEALLSIHPETERVFVISDHNSLTSKSILANTIIELKPLEDRVTIEYIDDVTITQLEEQVSKIEQGTVILLQVFNKDLEGNSISASETIKLLSETSKVPIYSPWSFYLGEGIVGGRVTKGDVDGSAAAEMAMRVLNGENVSEIPIITSPDHIFIYDWEQMQRFSITEETLPEGSIILNKEIGFYEQYRTWIIIVLFIMLVQFAFIVNMFLVRRDLVKTEKDMIIAKEKAQESDRLKSSFLANMSHEIRTPMNAILGFSGVLKQKDIKPEKGERYVNLINQAGNNLLLIINDILDLSKIEADQMDVIDTNINLKDTTTSLNEKFKDIIEKNEKPITLVLDIDEDSGFEIYSDEHKIKQILSNLLDNAIKFTEEGEVRFGFSTFENKMIRFFVTDTGMGIPEDKLGTIFEQFRQVDEDHAREHQGTGLGLALSKAFAKLLGGDITVRSELGKGTTFYFTIPLKRENELEK